MMFVFDELGYVVVYFECMVCKNGIDIGELVKCFVIMFVFIYCFMVLVWECLVIENLFGFKVMVYS